MDSPGLQFPITGHRTATNRTKASHRVFLLEEDSQLSGHVLGPGCLGRPGRKGPLMPSMDPDAQFSPLPPSASGRGRLSRMARFFSSLEDPNSLSQELTYCV